MKEILNEKEKTQMHYEKKIKKNIKKEKRKKEIKIV